jgi:hypothetical protein
MTISFNGWNDFSRGMDEQLSSKEKIACDLIMHTEEMKHIVESISSSDFSDQISSTLVPLIVNSFRNYLSIVKLSLSGYPDSGKALMRIFLDIKLWLKRIKEAPLEACYGYNICNVNNELKLKRNILKYEKLDDNLRKHIERRIGTLKENIEELKSDATQLGLDCSLIEKRYVAKGWGAPNEEEWKDNDFKKERLTEYVLFSNIGHAGDFTHHSFDVEISDEVHHLRFGPVNKECVITSIYAATKLLTNLIIASEIVGDQALVERCKVIEENISKYMTGLGDAIGEV